MLNLAATNSKMSNFFPEFHSPKLDGDVEVYTNNYINFLI